MLKAVGRTQNGPVLLLGLSRRNCELLLDGRPIRIDSAALGLVGAPLIVLMAAETEQEMAKALAQAGLLAPNAPTDAPLPDSPVTYEHEQPPRGESS